MAEQTHRSTYILMKRERMIDNWSTIIEQGAGREKWFLNTVEQSIIDTDMPNLRLSQMDVQLGIFGQKRPSLVASIDQLHNYRIFVNARDFGTHLDVSWFLTCYQSRLQSFFIGKATNSQSFASRMSIFNQQDLSAFTFVVHHSVLKAAKMLMEELELDPTGMNTQSKGFLNVW